MAKMDELNMPTVHRVFSFNAPGALRVTLVGDFTHWQQKPISLRKHYDGIWRASVLLPPGTHRYRFLVDGEWQDDPECTLRLPSPGGNNVRSDYPSASQTRPADKPSNSACRA